MGFNSAFKGLNNDSGQRGRDLSCAQHFGLYQLYVFNTIYICTRLSTINNICNVTYLQYIQYIQRLSVIPGYAKQMVQYLHQRQQLVHWKVCKCNRPRLIKFVLCKEQPISDVWRNNHSVFRQSNEIHKCTVEHNSV